MLTGTNLADAQVVVNAIAEDLQGRTPIRSSQAPLQELLRERGVGVVSFADWLQIDAAELQRGFLVGKPREKCMFTL